MGLVTSKRELRLIENHIIMCALCAERADEVAQYVDVIRAAIIAGDFDLLENF